MAYRFSFRITNNENDETMLTDWTTFELDDIDAFGGVETIDITTGCAIRALRRMVEQERLKVLLAE